MARAAQKRPADDTRPSKSFALLGDVQTQRARRVREILRACGLGCMRFHAAQPPDAAPAMAVIACGREAPQRAEPLQLMRTLAASGCPVLAYGDGASGWSLGARSEVLLAGARHLLDSSAPDFPETFRDAVERVLAAEFEKRGQQESLKALFRRFGIVGESPAILALFRAVVRVSRLSDLTTLLLGETGTGKELLARAIHALDPKRCQGPFLAVNCGALPPALVESELFGYRAGAFTGAVRDRRGLFRSAHAGVLFLDEIGDLEPPLQGKLLRVLQAGAVSYLRIRLCRREPDPCAAPQLRAAHKLFRTFHCFGAPRVLRVRCRRVIPPVLVHLGFLRGLIYSSDRGQSGCPRTFVHFMRTPPRLLCDRQGGQLFILGGRYRITRRGIEG